MHFKIVGKLLLPKGTMTRNPHLHVSGPVPNSISQPACCWWRWRSCRWVLASCSPSQLLQRNYHKVFCLLHN